MFPGSTSDCLAFEGSSLYKRLESGLLADGLCLFGDNAYLNSPFMATPYSGVGSGAKDAYNFYHSQIRIRIECTFGMLTERWGILRSAMPRNISIQRTIALVVALAKLHNFCINESVVIESMTAVDEARAERNGAVPLETWNRNSQRQPQQLLGGGEHFDDMHRDVRRQRTREQQAIILPREKLLTIVQQDGLTRPRPTF
jgi:hypothetical protein